MSKPTLREQIAEKICTLNPRVQSWDDLDEFQKDSWRIEASQILNLLKKELEGLTVMGDEEIEQVIKNQSEIDDESPYGVALNSAQRQLSHTKEQLKAKLED